MVNSGRLPLTEPACRLDAEEQRVGLYAIWHHEHFFTALEGGRTEIRDLVHYVLPFGWLGNLAHPLLVAPQLQRIFAFREKTVAEHFAGNFPRTPS